MNRGQKILCFLGGITAIAVTAWVIIRAAKPELEDLAPEHRPIIINR